MEEDPQVREIIRRYRTPGDPIAFGGVTALTQSVPHLSKKRAREILDHIDSYTLHRFFRSPTQYNPYFLYHRRAFIQSDLIDVQQLASQNDDIRFLLLIIDCFTRRIWVYPLQRKNAQQVLQALKLWLLRDGGRRRRGRQVFSADGGKEFQNALVQNLLRHYNVELQLASGTSKACYAERANRTIQDILYKYLSDAETSTYIDKLPALVRTYNQRGHRSLRYLSPAQADLPRNEISVRAIAIKRYSAIKPKKPRFQIGQVVRIKTSAKAVSSSRRSYAEQFHGEYYRIQRINQRLPIPLYYIQSLDTLEHLEDGFYAEEITPVRSQRFKIASVLAWRGRGRQRQALVRWQFFSPRWDTWVNADQLERI